MVEILPNVFSKKTMYDGFRPIYCYSRIFGFLPFSIVRNSNGEMESCKVKTIDFLWFAISFCICLLLAMYNYYLFTTYINPYLQIAMYVLKIGNTVLVMLNFISSAILSAIEMYNRHKFLDILKEFEHFDREASWIFF